MESVNCWPLAPPDIALSVCEQNPSSTVWASGLWWALASEHFSCCLSWWTSAASSCGTAACWCASRAHCAAKRQPPVAKAKKWRRARPPTCECIFCFSEGGDSGLYQCQQVIHACRVSICCGCHGLLGHDLNFRLFFFSNEHTPCVTCFKKWNQSNPSVKRSTFQSNLASRWNLIVLYKLYFWGEWEKKLSFCRLGAPTTAARPPFQPQYVSDNVFFTHISSCVCVGGCARVQFACTCSHRSFIKQSVWSFDSTVIYFFGVHYSNTGVIVHVSKRLTFMLLFCCYMSFSFSRNYCTLLKSPYGYFCVQTWLCFRGDTVAWRVKKCNKSRCNK